MDNLLCFTAVEFVNDPKVKGWTYWYLCTFDGAEEGDKVIAPLGRHDNIQTGLIRKVSYTTAEEAPYPADRIKKIVSLIKADKYV
ncbi:MAG: hypothetical protein HFE40_05740 [Clostridia bacterium]|jgi:hypothetical protein|nr:hypothetical protein [Clostridia bacterium]